MSEVEHNAMNYWWKKHVAISELLSDFMRENKIGSVLEAITKLLENYEKVK